MNNNRTENRLFCAELVDAEWHDKTGRLRREIVNLEDVSLSGACIHTEDSVAKGTTIVLRYGDGELVGVVRYCLYRDAGYFLGIEFTGGCKWSTKHFQPKHLLDPYALVERSLNRPHLPDGGRPRPRRAPGPASNPSVLSQNPPSGM